MYILNGNGTQIVSSEFVERFCVVEKEDAALIVLSYSAERPPVTLARYKDVSEAKETLSDLFGAIAGGQACYTMPESQLFGMERIKKDARTKRRGGS